MIRIKSFLREAWQIVVFIMNESEFSRTKRVQGRQAAIQNQIDREETLLEDIER